MTGKDILSCACLFLPRHQRITLHCGHNDNSGDIGRHEDKKAPNRDLFNKPQLEHSVELSLLNILFFKIWVS